MPTPSPLEIKKIKRPETRFEGTGFEDNLSESQAKKLLDGELSRALNDQVLTEKEYDELKNPDLSAKRVLKELIAKRMLKTELPRALKDGVITQEEFDTLSDPNLSGQYVQKRLIQLRMKHEREAVIEKN